MQDSPSTDRMAEAVKPFLLRLSSAKSSSLSFRFGTRAKHRLDRDFGRKRWGDEGYAQEELVAELGSAFLAADLGLELESFT